MTSEEGNKDMTDEKKQGPWLEHWTIRDIPAHPDWWNIEIHMCFDVLVFVCAEGFDNKQLCLHLAELYHQELGLLNHIWPYIYDSDGAVRVGAAP